MRDSAGELKLLTSEDVKDLEAAINGLNILSGGVVVLKLPPLLGNKDYSRAQVAHFTAAIESVLPPNVRCTIIIRGDEFALESVTIVTDPVHAKQPPKPKTLPQVRPLDVLSDVRLIEETTRGTTDSSGT